LDVDLVVVEEVTPVLVVRKVRALALVLLLDLDLKGGSCHSLDDCLREVLTISLFPLYISQ
jgi:hypothetical protein